MLSRFLCPHLQNQQVCVPLRGPGWSRRPGGCGATPALPQADISGSFHSRKMFDLYSSYLLTQSELGSVTVAAAAAPPCTQQVCTCMCTFNSGTRRTGVLALCLCVLRGGL